MTNPRFSPETNHSIDPKELFCYPLERYNKRSLTFEKTAKMTHTNHRKAVFHLFALVLLSLSALLSSSAFAADVEMLYFYEAGCPSCEELDEFLNQRIRPNYPVVIIEYEIHTSDNANLMLSLAAAYDAEEIIKKGTPAIFVGEIAFHGSSKTTMSDIEKAIQAAVAAEVTSPLNQLSEKAQQQAQEIKRKLTLPAVLAASAVDSINPCAFGVLTLLLSTMLVISKSRNRVQIISTGLAFTTATFICYLLMGFGLFSAIRFAGLQHYIYLAVSIMAILIGLWNVKDYFWYERGINIEVPQSWRPRLKKITASVTSVPSAFIIGCLVSVFLLPCTSGPYVVIIGMLSDTTTRLQAAGFLVIYNFIFVLPFIIITLAVAFGITSPGKVESWRQKWLKKLHLATGILMLIIGCTLVTLLILGII